MQLTRRQFLAAAAASRALAQSRPGIRQAPAPRITPPICLYSQAVVKIDYAEVLFVEALQNYVTIHTTSKKYLSYVTFKSVEDFLPQREFIKIHKSFIVSMSKIDSIEGNEIRIGTHRLPISRTLKEEVVATILRQGYLRR